jgi:hypothetical protein
MTPVPTICQPKQRVAKGTLAGGYHVGHVGERAWDAPNPEP